MASPLLAAAGSGGEGSSGSEGTGPAGRDLAELFEQAATRLPALLPAASKEQLLYLYARYKQVRRERPGPVPGIPRPGRGLGLDASGRAWGSPAATARPRHGGLELGAGVVWPPPLAGLAACPSARSVFAGPLGR